MHADAAEQVLFIFAHQDDEMAAASRILFEQARGAIVWCAYLTDGSLGGPAERRNGESLAALATLNVSSSRVRFIGSEVSIADGALAGHLDTALRELEQSMHGLTVTRIYCLAWEGGHHDHDASHLVAVAYARRRGLLDRCYELPLYRASLIPRLFRVLSPLPPRESWQIRRLRLRDALRIVALVRQYPSQRRSWLGLFPGLFLALVILRREALRPVDIARLSQRPHAGTLLYESRFGMSSATFRETVDPFISAHLPKAW